MELRDTAKTPRLLTVAEYYHLDIPGRTELLGGLIYDVSPKTQPHSFAVSVITRALNRDLGEEYIVRIQDPIAVDGWQGKNAPEIDVAVVVTKDYEQIPTHLDSRVHRSLRYDIRRRPRR
jgi:hypothetical protein